MSRSPALLLSTLALFFLSVTPHVKAGSVSLQWDPNPEPDIDGYRVYYGTSSGSYNQQINVGNTTAATVSNLTNGSTYFFVVTAFNTVVMESLPSNEVSASVPVGPTPTPTPSPTPAVTVT